MDGAPRHGGTQRQHPEGQGASLAGADRRACSPQRSAARRSARRVSQTETAERQRCFRITAATAAPASTALPQGINQEPPPQQQQQQRQHCSGSTGSTGRCRLQAAAAAEQEPQQVGEQQRRQERRRRCSTHSSSSSSSSVRQDGERRRVESVCPGTESLSERPAQLAQHRVCFAQAARDLAAYAARLTRTARVSRTAPTRARSWSLPAVTRSLQSLALVPQALPSEARETHVGAGCEDVKKAV